MFYYTGIHKEIITKGRMVLFPADESIVSAVTIKWAIQRFSLGPNDTICLLNIRNNVLDDVKLLKTLALSVNSQIQQFHRENLKLSFRILELLANETSKSGAEILKVSLCFIKTLDTTEEKWNLAKLVKNRTAFAVLDEKYVDTQYELAVKCGFKMRIFMPD